METALISGHSGEQMKMAEVKQGEAVTGRIIFYTHTALLLGIFLVWIWGEFLGFLLTIYFY